MTKHVTRIITAFSTALALLFVVSGCGYNELQGLDEEVKGAWGEVQNQYQRRADLIPNLVATVKGASPTSSKRPCRKSSRRAAPRPRSNSTPKR